jgi:plastocyanin
MRFGGIALVASALVLAACGGEKKGPDSAAAVDSAAASTAAAPAAAPATGTAAPAPITGTTHEVKMIGDDKGYRFEPADLTVKAGDGVKFVFVSGGPHNVAFDPASVPDDVKPQLNANIPNSAGDLAGPMLLNPNESTTISFGNVKPGTYDYHCTPHLAMNMKGKITVQ